MSEKAYIKSLKQLILISVLLVVLLGCYTTAASLKNTDSSDQITVLLNGTKLEFDVDPYIKNGRTLVPFRKIFEAFGLDIEWNGTNQTVLAKDARTELFLNINSKVAYVNNYKKTLDVPPEITNSRTFVPLRFIGESIGANVEWDGNKRTVTITYSDRQYTIGQTGTYGDLRFSIDSVNIKPDQNMIKVIGKVNSEDKTILLYLFESVNNYLFTNPIIVKKDGDMYNFEASAFLSPGSDFEKVNYIELKTYSNDNKIIKVASYSVK
jgi:hypothetical protein